MSSDIAARLADWLSVHRPRASSVRLCAAAMTSAAETRTSVVAEWPADGSESAAELAEAIHAAAELDAADVPGLTAFVVKAMGESAAGAEAERARMRFRMRGDDRAELGRDALDPEEPASLAGVLRQQMRHTEAAVKLAVSQAQGSLLSAQRENERLRAYVAQLEASRLEQLRVYEDLLCRRDEREAARVEREQRSAYLGQVVAKVSHHLPELLGLAPGAEPPELASLSALVRSLTPAQIDAITDALDPAQAEMLAPVLAKLAAPSAPTPTPTNHAATPHPEN